MPSRTLPGLGLKGDWDLGENGWKDEMDANLRVISTLLAQRVQQIAAVEPATPTEGDVVILDASHSTYPNQIAVFDEAEWHYIAPLEGLVLFNLDDGLRYEFVGGSWAEMATGGGGGGAYRVGWFYTTALAANETAAIHVLTQAVTFAANWAGAAAAVDGTLPDVDLVLDIRKNNVSVGTLTIDTSGVAAFASTGGAAVDFAIGDRLRVVGPAVANAASFVSGTFEA